MIKIKSKPTVAWMLCCVFILITTGCLSFDGYKQFSWPERFPTSWGGYELVPVANEVLFKKLYPDAEYSACGLADDDFIEHVRERIDHRRKFQFIVFISGTPLVGKECLQGAYIFYKK